jgi:hypothetical protein
VVPILGDPKVNIVMFSLETGVALALGLLTAKLPNLAYCIKIVWLCPFRLQPREEDAIDREACVLIRVWQLPSSEVFPCGLQRSWCQGHCSIVVLYLFAVIRARIAFFYRLAREQSLLQNASSLSLSAVRLMKSCLIVIFADR